MGPGIMGEDYMSTRSFLMAIVIFVSWSMHDSALAQYQFQPGDMIQISVWQEPRLDRQIIVAPDGSLALPLVGRVQAGGRTAGQVEEAIRARLAPQYEDELDITVHLVAQPDVDIPELEVPPRIYVTGEVARPGEFPILTPTTVLQAIALSGGLSPFAAESRIQVHRKLNGRNAIHLFNYRDFTSGVNPTGNIALLPGDVVVVPERRLFE
jgi:polysaccharide biosynthesis/export protein